MSREENRDRTRRREEGKEKNREKRGYIGKNGKK